MCRRFCYLLRFHDPDALGEHWQRILHTDNANLAQVLHVLNVQHVHNNLADIDAIWVEEALLRRVTDCAESESPHNVTECGQTLHIKYDIILSISYCRRIVAAI